VTGANLSKTEQSAQAIASEDAGTCDDRQPASLAIVVRNYLDKDGWNYEVSERNGHSLFSCGVTMKNANYRTIFDVCEAKSQFGVFVYAQVKIPEKHRSAVAEYIARVNHRIYLGKCEIDMDDGDIRTVVTVDVEGSALSREMVGLMENVAHRTMDHHYPGLMAICYGNRSAVEALAAVDEPEAAAESEDEVFA
jgi:hypothetical protein